MNQRENTLDILCFGAHPDDVEIGMGGTIAKYSRDGLSIGIMDLTEAELSSNGTIAIRQQEANASMDILGVKLRGNIGLPDRGLTLSELQIDKVISVIRKYRPKVIFSPYEIDRHPDHGSCTRLIREAVFSAGIKKWVDHENREPHKIQHFYTYIINGFHKPHFYVDISDTIDSKISALKAYESQFLSAQGTVSTPLTEGYIETVVAREKLFGKEIGVSYAEGFFSERPMVVDREWLGV